MVRRNKKIIASCIFLCIKMMKTIFIIPSGSCRFMPTCSHYAKDAFESLPVHRAIILIIRRIFRCHPFAIGGYDPLPEDCHTMKG